MKRHIVALVAIACALIAQGFRNEKRGCSELLYWFKVQYQIACEEVSTGDLTIPPITDSNNNGLPDELNSQYQMYASANPFGCSDGDFACAVGYRANQLRVNSTTHYWEPINASFYICCVRQP